MSMEFIAYLNFLLAFCPLVPREHELRQRFEAIGIGPSLAFDPAALEPDLRADIEAGVRDGQQRLKQRIASTTSSTGLFGSREALGEDYQMRRAVGAAMGIYGNSVEEAVYVGTLADAHGQPLDGSKRYVMQFSKDGLPPVRFFWSATMYDLPQRLLVANPIDRYSLGSRSRDLVYDPDGSLTIYVQAQSPGPGKKANWLPAPSSGPFNIVIRLYGPSPEVQSGQWQMPALELVG